MSKKLINEARKKALWTTWRIQLSIPSILATGEIFDLKITAFAPDGFPSGEFGKEIFFENSQGIEGLPESVSFSSQGDGSIIIKNLKATGPKLAYVAACPDACPGSIYSNPAWVFPDPAYRIFWGDLHVHTTYSNCGAWGCQTPEFCYYFASNFSHLDFVAIADHIHGLAADKTRWPHLQKLAKQYNYPNEFVTFLAFESSHKSGFGGDNNVYFLSDDAPMFCLEREYPEVSLETLWNFLNESGKDFFTVPHHTGRADKYRNFSDALYNSKYEPLFEIFSAWGSSESRRNKFPLAGGNSDRAAYFQDALKAGCRFGAIASSDDHLTLPGGEGLETRKAGPKRLSFYNHHGLTAIRSKELTRLSLWNSLWNKNCYATTFDRALLDVQIGDLCMGQEMHVSPSDSLWNSRTIKVDYYTIVRNLVPVDIILIRNGEEIMRKPWCLEQPEILFKDETPLDAVALRDSQFSSNPFCVYYVRVENYFHETQWSSPIWFNI